MDIKRLLDQAQRSVSSTYDSGMEALLDRMGLEHKKSNMESMLPVLGVFGAGIAVGAALGLLFAPKRGDELRNDIRHRIGDLRDRSVEQIDTIRHKSESMLDAAPRITREDA